MTIDHHPHPATEVAAPGSVVPVFRRVTARIHHPERRTVADTRRTEANARLVELQHAALNALVAKTTQLVELLEGQALNGVLETATLSFGADGTIQRDYRVPYAAVMVANATGQPVSVQAGGRGVAAPGNGSGLFVVRNAVSATIPLVGTSLTLYGPAGAAVSFSVLSRPIPLPMTGPA